MARARRRNPVLRRRAIALEQPQVGS